MDVLHATPRGKVCLDADGSGTTLAWGDTGLEVGANGESGESRNGRFFTPFLVSFDQ